MPNVPFDIEIGSGTLPGLLHLPDGDRDRPLPAMVICGEVPGSVHDHQPFVEALTERLLSIDCAVAHFTARKDDAKAKADASTLVDDAQAVFRWLTNHDAIDGRSIGVLGVGLGAVVAAGLAARTDQVRCVCLVAPATNADALTRLAKPNGAPPLLLPNRAEADNAAWIASFGALTPVRDLAVHDRPTLIVRGSADRVVESVRPYVEAVELAGHHLEHECVARADHDFASPGLRDVCLDRIERFFRDNRKKPAHGKKE